MQWEAKSKKGALSDRKASCERTSEFGSESQADGRQCSVVQSTIDPMDIAPHGRRKRSKLAVKGKGSRMEYYCTVDLCCHAPWGLEMGDSAVALGA